MSVRDRFRLSSDPAATTTRRTRARQFALARGTLLAAILCFAASPAAAFATSYSWNGGTGYWGDATMWSPVGVPTESDTVAISADGTYTVYCSGTVQAKTLDLGGTVGRQTLSVVASASPDGGLGVRGSAVLTIGGGSVIGSHAVLELYGSPSNESGRVALSVDKGMNPGVLTNQGRLEYRVGGGGSDWQLWGDECHDLENGNSGTTFGTASLPWIGNGLLGTTLNAQTTTNTGLINNAWVGASNTAHASHHQDTGTMNVDGSPQCVNCHIAIPHGWVAPRLLVDTDVDKAPYVSNNQLGTTQAGHTGESTGDTRGLPNPAGVAHPGFNGQGMQSLSAVDNHLLVNGAAIWTEASCQGCGDHAGEDSVRIIR